MADLEEQVAFVFGKIDLRVGAGGAGKFFNFVHGFLGDQDFHFAVEAGEFLVGFGERQAMAVGGDHGERVGLQDQQAAVQACSATLPWRSRI